MTEQVSINADRGEVGLVLDGRVYPMLPTFAACNAIESELGAISSLVARLLRGAEHLPTWHELAVVATECIKAAGKDRGDTMLGAVNVQKIGEMLYEEGLDEAMQETFGRILGNMVSGGTNRKKARAAAAAAAQAATSGSPTES
jgi:tail tube GTA-gp10-like protein